MWNLKRNDTNEPNYRTETDSDLQKNLWWGKLRSLGWTGTHSIFTIDNQQGPTV